MYDEFQREVRIYDIDGRKIARRDAIMAAGQEPCGILMNLRKIHSLYNDGADNISELYPDGGEDVAEEKGPVISIYPQAYLRDAGHIQVKGVMPAFLNIIKDIQASFQSLYEIENADSDEAEEGEVAPPRQSYPSPIAAVSSQAYNELSHRASSQAGSHDVQQGAVTAAVSGCFAISPKNERDAKKIQRKCSVMLPHERFAHKITMDNVPRALRMEQVYTVDIQDLPESMRNGQLVFS